MRPNAASKLVPIQHVLEESDGGGRRSGPGVQTVTQNVSRQVMFIVKIIVMKGPEVNIFHDECFQMILSCTYYLMYIECPFKAVVGSFTVFTCVNKPRPQEVHQRRTGSGEEVQCDTPTVSVPKNRKWGRDFV